MFTRCPFCRARFPGNRTLEPFPTGRRVAFDPARGRLWAVCAGCGRWSLAPIDQRWEALEELERLVRDRARLRARTANVSLLRAGDLDIVRVGGDTRRREESHWRFGREFATRRRRAELIEDLGAVLDLAVSGSTSGLSVWIMGEALDPDPDPDKWLRWARARRFGRRVWSGEANCERCGEPLPPVRFEDRGSLVLEATPEGSRLVRRLCPACGRTERSGTMLDGRVGEQVLRRALAYENYAGGSTANVGDAVELLAAAGSDQAYLGELARKPVLLGRVPPRMSLALEIALAEERERELLQLEMAELERRWREEEELAAIVDGELTPVQGPASREE